MNINNWENTEEQFVQAMDADDLLSKWDQLHAADLAPAPAGDLLDAWLMFHNGHYAQAAEAAQALGAEGLPVLLRSVVAYTDYICEDEDE